MEQGRRGIKVSDDDLIRLFGLPLRNETLERANERIFELAKAPRGTLPPTKIFFVNAHCVNVASRDREYVRILHDADILYADGAGLAIAAKWAGRRFCDNVNGTDLFPILCAKAARDRIPMALLGGEHGVAELCAQKMTERCGPIKFTFIRQGYVQPYEEARVVGDVRRSGAAILLVAMGVPRQEKWIHRWSGELGAQVQIGVGGLFDFYSGRRRRAPSLFRKIGLEWTIRLAQEPGRLAKRYLLGNPEFLLRALRLRSRGIEVLTAGDGPFRPD
ncbi:MAG: WecB/TagA/CpsF family glycosyltransferase [Verrucomicrobiae bacterium]|nr:WecB/TagA/CpsF family glycosyltransferase [Verrucomicrobiae bacterium]